MKDLGIRNPDLAAAARRILDAHYALSLGGMFGCLAMEAGVFTIEEAPEPAEVKPPETPSRRQRPPQP